MLRIVLLEIGFYLWPSQFRNTAMRLLLEFTSELNVLLWELTLKPTYFML